MAWDGRRTLIGCAIGCGALVVVVLAVGFGFVMWLNAPGEVLEPERLLGADTTGYVELHLSLDDPETAAFVDRAIEGLQSISPEDMAALPAPIGGWVRSSREAKTRRDVEKLFPAVAAWTLRSDPTDEDGLHLFSVSLERASHQLMLADFVLGMAIGRDANSSKHRHGDETIYRMGVGRDLTITTFIADGIVFVTSDLDTAKRTIDRLREPADAGGATPLDRLFDGVPRDRPLRGAVTNAGGEARRIWERLAADGGASVDDALWDDVTGMALSGELDPDGSFVGFVDLALADGRVDAARGDAWRTAFGDALPEGEYEIAVEPQALDDRVRLGLRVPRLLELMVPREVRELSGSRQRPDEPGDEVGGAVEMTGLGEP